MGWVEKLRSGTPEAGQTPSFPRSNNIDWLRLLFASQVLFVHAGEHFEVGTPKALSSLPGVPAFFFFSGFLIYASYLNAPDWRYFANRFLRLMPALVLVTLGGCAVALVAHGWRDLIEHPLVYITWVISQVTLGQAYNPGHFRDVGVGVINGSLWTLTTEILFYLAVPVIVFLEKRFKPTVLVLTALSFAVYAFGPALAPTPIYRDKTLYDLMALTPIAWGWMFGFGMLALQHYGVLARHLKFAPLCLVPLAIMAIWGDGLLFGASGNRLGLVYFASYVAILLYLAFMLPAVKLTADFSYGVYIWHMPIINLLLVLARPSLQMFWLAAALTFAVAAASWYLVEKPALKLKPRSLHKPGG